VGVILAFGKSQERGEVRNQLNNLTRPERNRYFRLAVESAPSAMVMVNHEGRIVLVNSSAEKLFGYESRELLGQPVEILLPESSRRGHPGFREDLLAQPQARPMGAGRALHAQRKNGEQFLVEIGLNPIETKNGTWVLSSIVDISDRQRAEAKLRESEERFRNMADTAPVMIWVSGPDKLRTFFNKTWLEFTGCAIAQELGNGWTKSVHPDDVDRCIATYSASFDARVRFRMEYRLRRADGEYRCVLDDGAPRFTSGGIFAGYIGCCIDIGEVKRMQEEALASQKLESVGQLARGIAHDFNNLLGGILACADLALASRAEGLPWEEELLRIRTSAIRGGEIVRQLMTYGGEESPAFETIDLSLLVNEMLQLLKVSISKNAILETELGEHLPALQANPAQIRQVVMNLVTNASEAIGTRDGVIRVTTERVSAGQDARGTGEPNLPAGDYVKLEVSDTGSGMTPEVRTKIFDPFFTTKSAGRGLGLAAVQGIVRSHFGAINVVSSLGQGTRFEVLLPCIDQPMALIPDTVPKVSAGEVARVTGTILVVEDEDTLRLVVSKTLRKSGISVIEAIDGRTAVNLFRANAPDIAVVLLDMTLPGMSGPEVYAELRRIRPEVKVILTTAFSQQTALTAFEGQQAWAYIRKPYQIDHLVSLILDVWPKTEERSHYVWSQGS
jgi:two-component system cell cycle sensor histidine kinase/response regulator CckA